MSSPALKTSPSEVEIDHLGLIAGEGKFPFLIARAARSRSVPVTAIGVQGVTSPELEAEVDEMRWVKFGEFDQMIQHFHDSGISKAVMAGRIKHSSIFQLAQLDSRGRKLISKLVNKKADTVLSLVAQELESESIEVLDSTMFVQSCMPPPGLLTPRVPPSKEVQQDIDFATEHANGIAAMDIGQTVIVKSQTVVAVEAMEGTDKAIERAGQIAGEGTVVVKVGKPLQDKRFDVPVLGLRTIQKMGEAKSAALAFPGHKALFFDREESVELAQSHGITIIAFDAPSSP